MVFSVNLVFGYGYLDTSMLYLNRFYDESD
ncbi:MAG: hypothetical protein NBKEAIPA_03538 [Nitrospirae bacterium]|nr:MAG: hypothetical protein UZ03_NOB001000135 [Nitrospira sp. OLB3]MBV6471604.1 hypothetical protein [Nitrospirota bacterium]